MSIAISTSSRPVHSINLVYNFEILKNLFGGAYPATKWINSEGLFQPIINEVSRQSKVEIDLKPSEIIPIYEESNREKLSLIHRIENVFHFAFKVRMEPHANWHCSIDLSITRKLQQISPEDFHKENFGPAKPLEILNYNAILHPFKGRYDDSHISFTNLKKIQRYLLQLGQRKPPDRVMLEALED